MIILSIGITENASMLLQHHTLNKLFIYPLVFIKSSLFTHIKIMAIIIGDTC